MNYAPIAQHNNDAVMNNNCNHLWKLIVALIAYFGGRLNILDDCILSPMAVFSVSVLKVDRGWLDDDGATMLVLVPGENERANT